MTVVVDASAIVAALVDSGEAGRWVESQLVDESLAAPHLMPVEATNILRRAVLAGAISTDVASLAHHDLLQLRVDYVPYEPLAMRVWQLRDNLSAYDAWYVGLAEALGVPLITLDERIARAPGVQCEVRVPT